MYICTTSCLSILCQWTFRLIPCPGYCKQCCHEYWGHVYFQIKFFSRHMPKNGIAGSYGSSVVRFLRNLPTVLSDCTSLHSHQQCKHSLFSTSSPAFIVCRFFYDGHSDWCGVISHCSFDLYFSNNERC